MVAITLGYSFPATADILSQQRFKTHLRWNIFTPKDLLSIKKTNNIITIRSLNTETFSQLSEGLRGLDLHKTYIQKITIKDANTTKDNIAVIEIALSNDKVDLFNFYRSREKKYVLDFWIDTDDSLKPIKTSTISTITKAIKPNTLGENKAKEQRKLPALAKKKMPKKAPLVKEKGPLQVTANSAYRDFRYGAAFIWNNPAVSPRMQKIIDLNNKTPEVFYSIKNAKFKSSDKEAHMQISINMYRKRKFGLMHKSIKLYQKKYGELENADINEYLKANAILRKNFKLQDPRLKKMALNILSNIADSTSNYELKRGIFKYLISHLLESKEYLQSLKSAKKLYVFASEAHDIDEAKYGAEAILYSLAQLNQINKIAELLEDKTVQTLIPAQVLYAYEIYTNLKLGHSKRVIERYENKKIILGKPVHETILINTAEAYFRSGQYEKSINLNDEYLNHYSHLSAASYARLRIGLSYEILDKSIKETENLYLNTINRSQNSEVSLEAKLRYVALKTIRKIKPTKKDLDLRVFLEGKDVELNKDNKKIMRLLWLVRLRTFIADKKFHQALSYLNVLPLNSMLPSERRVFEADGSEAVYGRMIQFYRVADYSQIVRVWEVFRDKYFSKVSGDPVLNYIVGHSYIKLGLYNGFEKQYNNYKKTLGTPIKTYPNWNNRYVLVSGVNVLEELIYIKHYTMKNWKTAERLLDKIEKLNPSYKKIPLYRAKLSYQNKKYDQAINFFEKYLANTQDGEITDPREVADMLKEYTESLYQLGKLDRYKKVADAILKDTGRFGQDSVYMNKIRERITYLNLEILAGEDSDESYLILEDKIRKFKDEYKDSIYHGRVNYLFGVSLVKNKKKDQGKEILRSLLVDEKAASYIKELAKSELSLLKIKERTL